MLFQWCYPMNAVSWTDQSRPSTPLKAQLHDFARASMVKLLGRSEIRKRSLDSSRSALDRVESQIVHRSLWQFISDNPVDPKSMLFGTQQYLFHNKRISAICNLTCLFSAILSKRGLFGLPALMVSRLSYLC